MSLVLYQTRSGVGCGASSENQDQLTITIDGISGKGDSYDFRRDDWEIKDGETTDKRDRC